MIGEHYVGRPGRGRHRRPAPDVRALGGAEAARAREERAVAIAFYRRFVERLRRQA